MYISKINKNNLRGAFTPNFGETYSKKTMFIKIKKNRRDAATPGFGETCRFFFQKSVYTTDFFR